MNAISAKKELLTHADKSRVPILMNFFKTGKGQYGEGDIFAGVYVPQIRSTAKLYTSLNLSEIEKLLKSKIHEVRLLALIILTYKYKKSEQSIKKEIYDFYLSHTKYINNWDLVDISAKDIIGTYIIENRKKEKILEDLASSKNLWERRISIIATFAFIYEGEYSVTFKIAKILLKDKEDLIHKAVGWMLREVGKRVSKDAEIVFLNKYYEVMPRTMLRYAIEHFTEEERSFYMSTSKVK